MCGTVAKWGGLPLYTMPYMLLMDNIYKLISTLAWIILFRVTGHADGFKEYVRDNSLSKIVVPISNLFNIKRNSQTYDALFWFIKGGLIALLPSILIGNYWLMGSAIAYPLGYYIGQNKMPNKLDKLMCSELITGFFVGLTFVGAF
jgi:hypothetical protein